MGKNVIDLTKMTPEAIKSNVLNTTITNPMTIYPMCGGALTLAFWFIFEATWIFTLIGGLAVSVGVGLFLYNYFGRFYYYQTNYFAGLRRDNERIAKKKLRVVQQYLGERGWAQGAAQVDKLQVKMESFERVLDKKFETGEMAHARYHGIAEQVYMNALETLEQVVIHLEAIDSIDPDYIEGRIEELEQKTGTPSEIQERDSLIERYELRQSGLERAEILLAQNEKAMTGLDVIASDIATAKTDGKDVEMELASAIKKLNDLGEEAKKYWG